MKRVKVLISGIVVGIFFRRFVMHNAIRLGVNGYVKNINHKVEAVFEGNDEQVDNLIELCRQGPVGSKIEKVEVKEEKYKGEFKSFEVIR